MSAIPDDDFFVSRCYLSRRYRYVVIKMLLVSFFRFVSCRAFQRLDGHHLHNDCYIRVSSVYKFFG